MVLVKVVTPVKATEDPAQVKAAVNQLFPEVMLEQIEDSIHGSTNDLRPLRKRIWDLQIIDTFRGQFLHGTRTMASRSTRFRLSKQAAHAGKVSFPPTPHALGDIEVSVTLEDSDTFRDIEAFGYWLCPETKDGEITGPILP